MGVLVGCACSVLCSEEPLSFMRTVHCAKPHTVPLPDRFGLVWTCCPGGSGNAVGGVVWCGSV